MAGGGKRGEASSRLLVTLLAFFATDSSAARVTPRPQPLARVHLRRRLAGLLPPFRLHQLRVCPQRVHLRRSCGLQGLRGRFLWLA
ncbi:unnamed protein product [Musa acuminata subsp. malaccensis]|uniref:(wild Malaysian banana) hypothetical protein n=1 Tax=Musa acuminata subsp. malaccensis TaxID=214687 RepID=A0A804L399_MUSAM|nr:unnamed protein product [Musa acuminata subsp. malaccensis]